MQYLYAAEISDFEDTKEHYKNLTNSIHSIHYLFLLQISFLIEILKRPRINITFHSRVLPVMLVISIVTKNFLKIHF